jgi:hypothetical protein
MKYIILILALTITTTSCAQTKQPRKKSVKTTKVSATTDSTVNRAVKAAIDSLKAHGYIKD